MISRSLPLLNRVITSNVTVVGEAVPLPVGIRSVALQVKLTVTGGGGTAKVYLQTTLDGGVTWTDIACVALTTVTARRVSSVKNSIATGASVTPTDGTMTDNTILDGIFGDSLRAKLVTAGTAYSADSRIEAAVVLH